MSLETAGRSIRFLLESPGQEKVLVLYGGEPMTCFDLVEFFVNETRRLAEKVNKEAVIVVGTNGILLEPSHLRFFNKNHVKLSISINGDKSSHDGIRETKEGESLYHELAAKIPVVLSLLKPADVGVLMNVVPATAHRVCENLQYLADLGFTNFGIDPMFSPRYPWGEDHLTAFKKSMVKIQVLIFQGIPKNHFIFLNEVNRELNNQSVTRSLAVSCPFAQDLEIGPDGEMAFSPFLLNRPDKDTYIIGNVNGKIHDPYFSCVYDPANSVCRECWPDYYQKGIGTAWDESADTNNRSSEAVIWKSRFSILLAREVVKQSGTDAAWRKYRQEAAERIFE